MATGPGFPGPLNTYVPNHEATKNLTVGFTRNPDAFNLPKYCQYVETKQMTGYWLRMGHSEQVRILDDQSHLWNDGDERPLFVNDHERFNFVPFITKRRIYGTTLGDLTKDQASWEIEPQHLQIASTKLMTNRTQRMITTATTSTNWTVAASGDFDLSVDHTDTATNYGGGKLDVGTSTAPYLKKAFEKVAVTIDIDTEGIVKPGEMYVLMNPYDARLIGASPEIVDFAKEEINTGLGPNNKFGLPSEIHGFKIIIENASRVTSQKGDTLVRSYIIPSGTLLFVSRPGQLTGVYGSPSFSTLTLFHYGPDAQVETIYEPLNKRTVLGATENATEAVTAVASGFLMTACTG